MDTPIYSVIPGQEENTYLGKVIELNFPTSHRDEICQRLKKNTGHHMNSGP